MTAKHRLEIEYCTQCRWMIRAAWVAQELLSTFESELLEVALIPGKSGIFEVRIGNDVIWALSSESRFPQPKELKQRVRDKVDPDRKMGHTDKR